MTKISINALLVFASLVGACIASTLVSPSDVTCSQIDFLFYDSQCCDSSNSVSCLKQLSKLEYDATIASLSKRIDGIVNDNDLSLSGPTSSLKVESQASIDVHSDSATLPSSINILQHSKLTFAEGAKLDVSKIKVEAGTSKANRAILDYVQLSDIRGKNDIITMDDPLHADKGIIVDGNRFTVSDVSGDIESRGSAKVWGQVYSGSLNVNNKLTVASDGKVISKGDIEVESTLRLKDGVHTRLEMRKDGSVEAKGLVEARKGLHVVGGVARLDSGLSVNSDRFSVSGLGTVSSMGNLKVSGSATIGSANKQHTLIGTTVVPKESTMIVRGKLDITSGELLYAEGITVGALNVSRITEDVDFNDKKILNAKVTGSLDGPLGSLSPDKINATSIEASGDVSLNGKLKASSAEIGKVTVSEGDITALSLETVDIDISDDLAVGGDASVVGDLTVGGKSAVKALTADSIIVSKGAVINGEASFEDATTFSKKILVQEEMQVGTGGPRKGINATDGTEDKACANVFARKPVSTVQQGEAFVTSVFSKGGICVCQGQSCVFLEDELVPRKVVQETAEALADGANGAKCSTPLAHLAVTTADVAAAQAYLDRVLTEKGVCRDSTSLVVNPTPTNDIACSGAGEEWFDILTAPPLVIVDNSPTKQIHLCADDLVAAGDAGQLAHKVVEVLGPETKKVNVTRSASVHPVVKTEIHCPSGYAWMPIGASALVAITDEEATLCADTSLIDTGNSTVYDIIEIPGGAVDFAKDGGLRTTGLATVVNLDVEEKAEMKDLSVVTVHVESIKQSSKGFSVSSAGAVTSKSLATSGTLDVAKKTTLSDELDVGKTATFLGDIKTMNGTTVGALIKGDGSVAVQSLSVTGPIEGQGKKFSVSDAGVVKAKDISVEGKSLPMLQEATSAKCTFSNGVIMFAQGNCSKAFRQWKCKDKDGAAANFGASQGVDSNMGSCTEGTISSTAADSCTQSNDVYCEALETRRQCEGVPLVPRIDGVTGTDLGTITSPPAQTWVAKGSVELKLCMNSAIVTLT